MEVSDSPIAIRFGTFELDVRSRELRKGDKRIRLQEQPFEILYLMLQRPGHLVTREELCQRLWPEGTFVDFEHSLNAAVKRLRAALGDDADNPKFVETLPRRGYRFIGVLEAAATTSCAQVQANESRIAVLPFNNLSNDVSQEYFSDGLTEELIAQLGPLCRGRIAVIARRSSMAFKGTTMRARDIAKVLSARYLLEGSVRRDGQRVRITARLVEGDNETELWSDTHERRVDDWLSVQADVAAHVARSLVVELAPRHLAARSTPDPRAHQAYLRARYHWGRPADEGFDDAFQCVYDAVRLAPTFACAHALLARLKVGAAEYCRERPRDALDDARAAATRALELDPSNNEARVALADVRRMGEFDWRSSRGLYRQVLAANPSSEVAHRSYAYLLAIQRRHDDAIRAADLARHLDPLCTLPATAAAWARYMAGLYEDAVDACDQVFDVVEDYLPAVRIRALARVAAGDGARAATELEHLVQQSGPHPFVVTALAHVYGSIGRQPEARRLIEPLRETAPTAYVSPYHMALAYVAVDDIDACFDALGQASRDRDPSVTHVAIEPRLEPIRRDPRYARLLNSLNLRPQPYAA